MTAKSKSKAERQAVRTRSKLSDLCLSILRDHPYSKSLCEPRRKVCILKMAKISKDTQFREEYTVCDNKELAILAVTQLSYVMPGYRKL